MEVVRDRKRSRRARIHVQTNFQLQECSLFIFSSATCLHSVSGARSSRQSSVSKLSRKTVIYIGQLVIVHIFEQTEHLFIRYEKLFEL